MAMKIKTLLLALALLVPNLAIADDILNPQTNQSALTVNKGQLPGTATNDSAAAGNVGEFQTNSASGVSFTSGSAFNITSLSLTAGDWDVWGYFGVSNSGTTTYTALQYSLSTTNSVLGLTMGENVSIAGATYTRPLIMQRFSLSAPTTIFNVCQFTFSGGTPVASGAIYARRVR